MTDLDRFTENLDVLAAAALAPPPEVGKQLRTVTELGAEQIERFIPGVGLLVFQNADVGQWLTKKNEPAKKAKRTYTLFPVGGGEGIDMESVSKIPGCLHKQALLAHYEDHGARGAVKLERMGELADVPEDEIVSRVRFFGFGADAHRDQAASRGTGIHGVLEQLAAGQTPERSLMPIPWLPWFDGAVAAWKALDPDPVEVEQIICHPTDRYAGRPDLVARIDGVLTLVDWKTGRGRVYKEGHYQARLYERARRACGFEPCERLIVVGVGEDGDFFLSDGLVLDEDVEALLATYRSTQRVDKALEAQRRAA